MFDDDDDDIGGKLPDTATEIEPTKTQFGASLNSSTNLQGKVKDSRDLTF